MIVVDVNTHFGLQAAGNLDLSLSRLVADLTYHQTALAFTCSLRGVNYDHEEGNAETLKATERYPWLLPAATLDMRRYLGWEEEVERCLRAGVRLFHLFPSLQGWTVSSRPFADLIAKLVDSGVVLMLSSRGPDNATAVAEATENYGLPVILTDTFYDNMAEVIATARRYRHIYVETNYLSSPKAVDIMVHEIGVERLLYGSSAPKMSIQRSLNEVLGAGITKQEKAAILGQNAIRLFQLDPALVTRRPRLQFTEMVHLPGPIIDVHCHLGAWRYPLPDGGAPGLLELMRMARVHEAIISSTKAIVYDLSGGNRSLASAIASYPQLLGYVVVNPNYLKESRRELDRYYSLSNFVGAKIHMAYSQDTTRSGSGQALLHEVAERGKPLKIHVEADQPGALLALRELAITYPHWNIIKAHGGNGQLAEIVADVPNIHFEFAGSGGCAQEIRQALDILGPRRVMFGSDADLCDIGKQVGVYYDAVLSVEEREQVMFANARRIFKLQDN